MRLPARVLLLVWTGHVLPAACLTSQSPCLIQTAHSKAQRPAFHSGSQPHQCCRALTVSTHALLLPLTANPSCAPRPCCLHSLMPSGTNSWSRGKSLMPRHRANKYAVSSLTCGTDHPPSCHQLPTSSPWPDWACRLAPWLPPAASTFPSALQFASPMRCSMATSALSTLLLVAPPRQLLHSFHHLPHRCRAAHQPTKGSRPLAAPSSSQVPSWQPPLTSSSPSCASAWKPWHCWACP